MADKTCENCQHWNTRNLKGSQLLWAHCSEIRHQITPCSDTTLPITILTQASFGCIRHQEKEPNDAE